MSNGGGHKPQSCACSFKGLKTPPNPPKTPHTLPGSLAPARLQRGKAKRNGVGTQACSGATLGTQRGHSGDIGDTGDPPPVLLTDAGAGSTPPARGCSEDGFAARLSRRVLFLFLLLFLAVLKVESFAEVLLPVGQGAGVLRGEVVTCEQKPRHSVCVPGGAAAPQRGRRGTEESVTPPPQKTQDATALRVFTTPRGSDGDV